MQHNSEKDEWEECRSTHQRVVNGKRYKRMVQADEERALSVKKWCFLLEGGEVGENG